MKKVLLVLCLIVIFASNFIFAKNSTIRRTSDTISQETIELIQTQTFESDFAASQETAEAIDTTTPQVFTGYGWFGSTEDSRCSSDDIIITGGETRAVLGTPNSGKTLETIKLYSKTSSLALEYAVKLSGQDWQGTQYGLYNASQAAGNVGDQSQKITNIRIKLDGEVSPYYDIYYRAYLESKGWTAWAQNNLALTTDETTPFESLDIRILPKGSAAPPDTVTSQNIPLLLATSHIENIGATRTIVGKDILIGSENSGQAVEGFRLSTSNTSAKISCQSYLKDIGWQDRVYDNNLSGTEGQGIPIEAVKIKLEGTEVDRYDIYYRTYVEGYGWLDWANNDQISGTTNQNSKIEALEVRILPKGSPLPGKAQSPGIMALNSQEGLFIKDLNLKRHEKGLPYVTSLNKLGEAAARRVNELLVDYNHIRPNNRGFETVLTDVEFRSDNIKPAAGECFTRSNDIEKVINNFHRRSICQNLLYSETFRYCSLAQSDSEPLTAVFLTDMPDNFDYLY